MRRATLLITLLALTGCYTDSNIRYTLSDDVQLSVLDPEAQVSYLSENQSQPLSVMRIGWEQVEFLVPVDGTDHRYIGRTDRPGTRATPRQRREFPTPESAVDLGGDTLQRQRFQSVEAPFWAAGDCLLLIPRLIGWQIANGRRAVSPDVTYDRYPDEYLTPVERALWLGEAR